MPDGLAQALDAGGWGMLWEAGPAGPAAFAVIVLSCGLLALRGLAPGAALLLALARRADRMPPRRRMPGP